MAEEKIKKEQEVEDLKEQETSEKVETAEKESKKDKKSEKKKSTKDKAEEKIKKIEDELAEMKDKHIRLQAEFDNYRKRTLKEKMELMKTGGEGVLVNILPVIDDFERALVAFSEMEDENPLKQGVNLIYGKFQDFLKQNGIKEIEAIEQEFDTDLHEAVTKIPAPKEELKGKVVDVIQKGYILNEKVIRFSKVVIGE
ncbi:nucleotide exchange factor GrpE [Sunxiuqinia sp. A32]|uniref:nucleotide exchange factor GrpE n=1 Tax=Sunxiuqinia sp. A32 TaxID=3461496 RepID=UPI004045EC1B